MPMKDKNRFKNSFWLNHYVENDYRKGSCPVPGGNARRQEKFRQKNPSFQGLSTEAEDGEQQEPKQGTHTTQGLLQPIQSQPQQVGVCVEHRSG